MRPTLPGSFRFVVSCEHGGREVPDDYRPLFEGAEAVLRSHRGWDPGALPLARDLARGLRAPLFASTTTRLLVDLNRSAGHRRVFSEFTRSLPPTERREILERYHAPYREAVAEAVERRVGGGGTVVHLSVHSFTPVLDGRERRTELALLYDPGRGPERELAARWVTALRELLPDRVIRRNHPYRGKADGLTTWLRRRFAPPDYVGIEIEVGQGLLAVDRFPAWVGSALLGGLGAHVPPTPGGDPDP